MAVPEFVEIEIRPAKRHGLFAWVGDKLLGRVIETDERLTVQIMHKQFRYGTRIPDPRDELILELRSGMDQLGEELAKLIEVRAIPMRDTEGGQTSVRLETNVQPMLDMIDAIRAALDEARRAD